MKPNDWTGTGAHSRRSRMVYLQSGQQPVAVTVVAAPAVVANSANRAAVHLYRVVFTGSILSIASRRLIRRRRPTVTVHLDSNVKPVISVDLQVGLKVLDMDMAGLLIGDLAHRAGVSPATIRYYEQVGLLPAPFRSAAGYRRYSDAAVDELRFIRKAQALGFSLDEITEILKLSRSGKTPCSRVLSLAHQHLAAIAERIRQLQTFHDQLAQELAKWDGKQTPTCAGLCQIIASSEQGDASKDDNVPNLRPRRPARRTTGRR